MHESIIHWKTRARVAECPGRRAENHGSINVNTYRSRFRGAFDQVHLRHMVTSIGAWSSNRCVTNHGGAARFITICICCRFRVDRRCNTNGCSSTETRGHPTGGIGVVVLSWTTLRLIYHLDKGPDGGCLLFGRYEEIQCLPVIALN